MLRLCLLTHSDLILRLRLRSCAEHIVGTFRKSGVRSLQLLEFMEKQFSPPVSLSQSYYLRYGLGRRRTDVNRVAKRDQRTGDP